MNPRLPAADVTTHECEVHMGEPLPCAACSPHYLPLSQLPAAASGTHTSTIDHLLHWPRRLIIEVETTRPGQPADAAYMLLLNGVVEGADWIVTSHWAGDNPMPAVCSCVRHPGQSHQHTISRAIDADQHACVLCSCSIVPPGSVRTVSQNPRGTLTHGPNMTPAQRARLLLAELDDFDTQCAEAEETDTGDAWNLLHALGAVISDLLETPDTT
jgi:hypothetical protein